MQESNNTRGNAIHEEVILPEELYRTVQVERVSPPDALANPVNVPEKSIIGGG